MTIRTSRCLVVALVVLAAVITPSASAARLDQMSLDRWKKLREVERYQLKIAEKYFGEKKWKVALPLRPDFEVEPNVFYIPPSLPMAFDEKGEFDEKGSRIPLEYLRELFGPGVEKALAKVEAERKKAASGKKSELIERLQGAA